MPLLLRRALAQTHPPDDRLPLLRNPTHHRVRAVTSSAASVAEADGVVAHEEIRVTCKTLVPSLLLGRLNHA